MNKKIMSAISFAIGPVAVFAAFIIVGFLLFSSMFNPTVSKGQMRRIFKRDYQSLTVVADFLTNAEYSCIYIPDTLENGKMSIGGNFIDIYDRDVVNEINNLTAHGYSFIEKRDDMIYFQVWSDLNRSRGIVYLIDNEKPIPKFLVKTKKLSKSHWYYYEEDYKIRRSQSD